VCDVSIAVSLIAKADKILRHGYAKAKRARSALPSCWERGRLARSPQQTRPGGTWMEDYFDRCIRDHKDFTNAIASIEDNPVKAGLCEKPSDWVFSSAWFRKER